MNVRTQRTGARQKRNRREIARIPDLGYYIIITDTEETEACFFVDCGSICQRNYKIA